jgi:NAD+ synthase
LKGLFLHKNIKENTYSAMKSPEKVKDHIVQWLIDYAQNAQMKGFVVGVSGGIDSAVTSTLCALTGLEVLCLEMPIHQHPDQVSRAQQHINLLTENHPNVKGQTVDLTPLYDQFVSMLPPLSDEQAADQFLSLANTRARLRMSTLYYFAGLLRYLVAGTGNRVEDFGVGFYTKYGDGGVDLSPIADLLKTHVFALGKHLGVDQSILDAPPTDGLWEDNRTDEQQIGTSYSALEWAMESQAKKLDPAQMTSQQKKDFDIYLTFNRQNQHKMLPIPVCQIPKAFL